MTQPASVIVSTRNRAAHITECLTSVLANADPEFEVIVVDQSDSDASHTAAAALAADPRVRWIRTDTRGLSVSRNVGLAVARGAIIAFTDDDCRVPAAWVRDISNMFAQDPELGLLFGAVLLRPEDRAAGYAAEFEPSEIRAIRHELPDMRLQWGVGANMAMRRETLDAVGNFDPLLGAGAPFFAGEEIDLTIRALTAGLKVVHTPKIAVLHLGIRTGEDASRLMRGYGFGLGATFSKHMRLGTPGSARALAQWLALHGERSVRNALRGKKNPGFGLVASVLWGACRSAIAPLDSQRATYVAPTQNHAQHARHSTER